LDTKLEEKSWNASRVAGLRGYHNIEPFQKQDGWVTQEQAAEELKVSNTVIKRLIREGVLPATQVVHCAPWVIDRKDLDSPAVRAQVQAVHDGRRLPPIIPDQGQLSLE
jgi:excisionase family DNA binding protein